MQGSLYLTSPTCESGNILLFCSRENLKGDTFWSFPGKTFLQASCPSKKEHCTDLFNRSIIFNKNEHLFATYYLEIVKNCELFPYEKSVICFSDFHMCDLSYPLYFEGTYLYQFQREAKSLWSNVFWYVKKYVFWKFIQNSIHWDNVQTLQKSP